ncbi:MAG: hypothetical protein JXR03_19935 [Cyclobacteriaceae bacterium]
MQKNLFYSWQSDLPNNKNRSFIEDCIKIAVKSLKNENIHLEVAIDRDTKDVSGTPDIASTIFSKIEGSSAFIADISFINPESQGKKTPNPNVLIELGYAAKSIGWNNIICVFNEEFGKIEELPFDLRFRRPLSYRIKNQQNKSEDRKVLSKQLEAAIESIIHNESEKDEIRIHIKQQVDKEILTICNHSFKILYGYEEAYSLDSIWKMLSLSNEQLKRHLFERKFLGFTVLKDWRDYMTKIEGIMNQPFFNQNAEPKYVNALLKVIRALEMISTIYQNNNLFEDTDSKESKYKVVDGSNLNPDNPPDSYLLLGKLETKDKGVVIDFGTIRKYNSKRLLNYQTISGDNFQNWTYGLKQVFESIESWVDKSGNHLIIDPLTFRT